MPPAASSASRKSRRRVAIPESLNLKPEKRGRFAAPWRAALAQASGHLDQGGAIHHRPRMRKQMARREALSSFSPSSASAKKVRRSLAGLHGRRCRAWGQSKSKSVSDGGIDGGGCPTRVGCSWAFAFSCAASLRAKATSDRLHGGALTRVPIAVASWSAVVLNRFFR